MSTSSALQRRAAFHRPAPAGLDVLGEGRDVAGLFAGLVGGVFLRALVLQHVAQAGRQVQRALLAVQDRGEGPQRRLVDEPDPGLPVAEVVGDIVGRQRHDHVLRQEHLVLHVEGLVEVDVFLVQRIPEVVVGGRDDLVEGGGAVAVAVQLQHRLEVVGRDGVVDDVLGDVAVGGHGFAPHLFAGGSTCGRFAISSRKMTGASGFALVRRRLDGVDVRIGQAEVVADLVDQHVGDQFLQGDVAVLRPLVQDRAAVEEDRGWARARRRSPSARPG